MASNFWTEDRQVIKFEDLIKLDLKNKIKAMENQVMTGSELANYCYNYDYFIFDKKKALQFITDYADEFVKALDKYKRQFGKEFNISNPIRVVNLMALLKADELIKQCEFVRSNEAIVFNNESKEAFINAFDVGHDIMVDKVITTRANLREATNRYIEDNLRGLLERNASILLNDAIDYFENVRLPDRVAKSILMNNYNDIAKMKDLDTSDFTSFMNSAVYKNAKEVLEKEFNLEYKRVPLREECLQQLRHSPSDNVQETSVIVKKNRSNEVKKENTPEVQRQITLQEPRQENKEKTL